MSTAKPRILLIGLYKPTFGFTRVLNHINKALMSDFEVHYLGVGYQGDVIQKDEAIIYPGCIKNHESDILGIQALKNILPIVQPKMAIIVHDLHWLGGYVEVLNAYNPRPIITTYIPMDGYLKNPSLIQFLEKTDHCFAYTAFGKSNLKWAEREIRKTNKTFALPPISIVAHGVDTETFYPVEKTVPQSISSRKKSRDIAFPGEDLQDAFIIMNGNQPWPRKQLNITIEGFAKFSRNKPKNVRLYLHHGFSNADTVKQIEDLIKINGLQKRILRRETQQPVSESAMNHFYNACDIGINTAMGEGWGLVSFEHAATGAPQIVPNHTACGEIWKQDAYLLRTSASKPVWFSPLEMKEVTVKDVAHSLEILYQEETYRNLLAKGAYECTTQEKYNWETIEKQWNGWCKKLLGYPEKLATQVNDKEKAMSIC